MEAPDLENHLENVIVNNNNNVRVYSVASNSKPKFETKINKLFQNKSEIVNRTKQPNPFA
jgi:hypothetical protein